ncbi:MAG: leucine--tRNA ligase, partial [Candidatus Parcubacteria bacterium]|nr:leucine--tRNA ligase [Candidatus Parcubacteria bacterium]
KYDHLKIEKKWQKEWAKNNFKVWQASATSKNKKFYILDMFPYPSGDGLHVGHVESYTASDILSRYYRMKGYNVLNPMGWDAFGLPAENYAIKTKTHPAKVVAKNITCFRQQSEAMGFSYDWTKTINTTDPQYYKWTQWIFLKLYEKGLAYEAEVPVNWCDTCKTVLANEEASDSKCDRCGSPVVRKNLRQWLLKITAYADRLVKDLDLLDWPEQVKTMQKNWIGKSKGAEVFFKVADSHEHISVFTTRPDTIFGATYLVLAPEHPLVLKITDHNYLREVQEYISSANRKSDFERQMDNREKTGVFTGAYAVNPATRERIPVWISDYVLINYASGAIMAVPAHDKRDYEFSQRFHLPINEVISLTGKSHDKLNQPYEGDGILVNSGPFSGMPNKEASSKILLYIGAQETVKYKIHDWIFSRQRYWGEPIPIIRCPHCGNVPLSGKDLPLKLPEVKNYQPSGIGESPLANIESWVKVKCPKCGGWAERETNTMPQWAGSCWYYMGYLLSDKLKLKDPKKFWDKKVLDYWLPVDFYIGGLEHAVLHLLYARFWHKFLYDIKIVSQPEPFYKLVNQGMILGADGEKMSKSLGNVVNPTDIIKKYGADTLRLYEMFMGPLADAKPWNTNGILGMVRFLSKVWQVGEYLEGNKKDFQEKIRPLNKQEIYSLD